MDKPPHETLITDPEPPSVAGSATSEAAGASIVHKLNQMQAAIRDHIHALGEQGATCDEVEAALGMKHQTASARIRELRAKSKIVNSDRKRPTRSNRMAVVYVSFDTKYPSFNT
jgi:hypothetical protein